MAFSEIGCSEVIINLDKIQDMCNPAHYLCILSVIEKYCLSKLDKLLHMYVMKKTNKQTNKKGWWFH